MKDSEKFNLVAYSYGTSICLEMASILEKSGKVGNIILIDGAPTMMHDMIKQQISAETENQFQNNVLFAIVHLYMTGEMTNKLLVSPSFMVKLVTSSHPPGQVLDLISSSSLRLNTPCFNLPTSSSCDFFQGRCPRRGTMGQEAGYHNRAGSFGLEPQ